ncbi:hypothetical protein BFW38_06005 [Terasakiispira papahanaumokuakeensis]|uniref:DUF4440 domain-containing protein n=1 Tax=Terasakiispira papahanaumokuakeensis TaxID=197479 RepID=A0A1E2V852_9GAMM|nr:nuclear transport factor 2 family protein [Terasakiispira papahanaumokuakeensis]ODC03167.1 hypothetical protein BFW38_06005 [Terasakiispira papahanaumokuakeensis]
MDNNQERQVLKAEKLLCKAMLESDTMTLDKLLSSDLVFTNHLGQILGKKDDLDAHESGLLNISSVTVDDQQIKLLQEGAVVWAKVTIQGDYDGHPANGTFRFTRVWQNTADDHWEVIAAHSSVVAV